MASIEKYYLKDGKTTRWMVRYDAPAGPRSRDQHKKKGFRTEKEAKAWAARVEVQIVDHKYIAKSAVTLSEAMDNYLALYCADLKPKTIESYKSIAKRVKTFPIAKYELQQISTEHIQAMINDIAKKHSPNTARRYYSFVNLVMDRQVVNRVIQFNPCRSVKQPKAKKHQHIILTKEDYAKLLKSAAGSYMYIPILLGGYMGLRRGEALGLRWHDLDLKKKKLHVRNNRQIAERKELTGTPKTEKSRRTLDIPAFAAKALAKWKKEAIIDISHDLVCSHSDGTPLSVNTFTRSFDRVLREAELSHMRFHDLRHTCAALLVAAGASPKEVSEYLGHSSITITMDLYADVFEQSKKDTAAKLNKLMDAAMKKQ